MLLPAGGKPCLSLQVVLLQVCCCKLLEPLFMLPEPLPQAVALHCYPTHQAVKYVESHLAIPTSSLGTDTLMAAAKTAMSSKIVGADSDFFGRIVVDAVSAVKSVDEDTGR